MLELRTPPAASVVGRTLGERREALEELAELHLEFVSMRQAVATPSWRASDGRLLGRIERARASA